MFLRNLIIGFMVTVLLIFSGCSPGQGSEESNNNISNGITFEPIANPEDLKITDVFDNMSFDPRLTLEWGFAALVEYGDRTLLPVAATLSFQIWRREPWSL